MGGYLKRGPSPIVVTAGSGRQRKPPVRIRYLLLLAISLGMLCVSTPFRQIPDEKVPPPVENTPTATEEINILPPVPVQEVVERKVRRGDTLYGILKGLGIDDESIMTVASAGVKNVNPSRLVAGRTYRVISVNDEVVEYQYEPDEERLVSILFVGQKPDIRVSPIPYDVSTEVLTGTIEDSLFGAVEKIGEKPSLALALSEIFAWQIDFFRDLRKGDSFRVLVKEFYRDGIFVRYGDILAAEFENAGNSYLAVLFEGSGGRKDYFDGKGRSLRKQFLKAPLRFRRISSGYTRRRLHPVTGKVVAHRGVDYAAPIGTPVRSIGDGKITLRRRDSINGRIIKIRHNSIYSSAYAHLNSFASGLRVGSKVRQGQIIGYVGKTGRATGPHLHLSMFRYGNYINPRSVKVPEAVSLSGSRLKAFEPVRDERVSLLNGKIQGAALMEASKK